MEYIFVPKTTFLYVNSIARSISHNYLQHFCVFSGTEQDGKYKDTVNLPKTKFGMRANSLVREPELQKLWEDNQVFKKVSERNDGVSYILVL